MVYANELLKIHFLGGNWPTVTCSTIVELPSCRYKILPVFFDMIYANDLLKIHFSIGNWSTVRCSTIAELPSCRYKGIPP